MSKIPFLGLASIATLSALPHAADARGARTTVDESIITGCDESVFAISYNTILYVDPAQGQDTNDGLSPATALKTLGAASAAALSVNASGQSVKVVLRDGEYRDSNDFIDFTPGGTPSPIEVVAENPGAAVIIGSDVWNTWTSIGNGTYTAPWPYDWGATTESWVPGWVKFGVTGSQVSNELLQRREQVFIDGGVQVQVLSQAELTGSNAFNAQGSYYVDETNNLLYLKPAAGIDPNQARTEVSVRPLNMRDSANRPESVIWIERDNVAIRGLVIQQHALAVRDAIHLRNSTNVVIEDCDVSYHPWAGIGLSLGVNQAVTIRGCVANYNGGLGIVAGGSGLKNIVIDRSVLNWNNWRGEAAGTIAWGTAGLKIAKLHDARMHRLTANWNRADGLWNDLEGKNVVWRLCVADENLRNGMDFEVLQGPVLLEQSRFVNNQRWQITVAATEDATLDTVVAWRDTESYYSLNGFSDANKRRGSLTLWQQSRSETDWETGTPLSLMPEYWTIQNSGFRERDGRLYNRYGVGSGGDPLLTYENWFSTLLSNNNTFYKTSTSIAQGDASDDPEHDAFDNQNNQERPLSQQSGYTDYWQNFSGKNDGIGQDLQSAWADFAPDDIIIVPPGQPSQLRVLGVSSSTVDLDWIDNSSNESAFVLEYSTDGINFSVFDSGIPADTGSLTASGLEANSTYWFRVFARNASGRSPDSFTVRATTDSAGGGDITPPAAPQGLGAQAADSVVDLDWNDNIEPDLAGYRVYRSTMSGSGHAQVHGGLVSTSVYSDTSAANGTTYYYIVTAEDSSGNESSSSQEVSATPASSGPTECSISQVVVTAINQGGGNKSGKATVRVLDQNGAAVSGATVSGTFSGSYNESTASITDASGDAILETTATARGGVTFTFCVDSVSHPTLIYNASSNVQTCASF